ncbi:MAG: hypothetical protein ACYC42_11260 [Lysobacter sp.]
MNPMKPISHRAWIVCTVLLSGLVLSGHASAQTAIDGDDLGSEWIAVPPERLDELRGGFVMPSGLLMSFGIERAVYVDGQLVATARFNVPDIARITVEQATALAGMQDTMLVQVGEGNTFVPNGMGGIVIQNTLDNLDIRALTTISVASSTLGMFQDLNSYAALQGALLSAPGGP